MKCSPEFRKRVTEQAELARRKTGCGYTGQLFFTYGEVKWILADLADLHRLESADAPLDPELREKVLKAIEDYQNSRAAPPTPFTEAIQHHQV